VKIPHQRDSHVLPAEALHSQPKRWRGWGRLAVFWHEAVGAAEIPDKDLQKGCQPIDWQFTRKCKCHNLK